MSVKRPRRGHKVPWPKWSLSAEWSNEFAYMTDWAEWHSHDTIQQILVEMRTVAIDVTSELWGPSPMTPEPVRPNG